jgi:hypothetical protein
MHGTVTAFSELIQRVTVESQYGPIPRNVGGPGAFLCAFMKEKCIMVRTLCLVFVLIGSGAAWAQSGPPHTAAEERACRGDAHRLCKDVLNDEFQVASCLQEHRNRVSRAVMESH